MRRSATADLHVVRVMLRGTVHSEETTTISEDTLEQRFAKCDEHTTGGMREDFKVYTLQEKKLAEFHLLSDEILCEGKKKYVL